MSDVPADHFFRGLRMLALGLSLLGLPGIRAAEKAKETNPPAPPQLVVALPPGVIRGVTNAILVRGQRLKEMTQLRLVADGQTNELILGKVDEVAVPERFKAGQVGDQQTALQLVTPAGLEAGTNLFLVAVSPLGESRPLPLFAVGADEFEAQLKPANGFREATQLPLGRFGRGQLENPRTVAVFRLEGRATQTLRVEVWAQRLGSTLDAALTLHDFRGAVLLRSDDVAGRDPVLELTLPADGTYFLSLSGQDERSSPTHVYLMRAALE